jgi:Reverse transcriptase (RNA-dependent DNA polymerase)
MPRFRAAGLDARLQPNSEPFRCMATARADYTRIVNHQRVQQLLRTRVPPAADRQLHTGEHVFVWRDKERKYCGPFAILNLSENGTQVTLNVDRGQRSGVFSADCVRHAPEMAGVFLAHISSTLSSYSNRAPGMHRSAYTKDEADVPVYVTEAVENKDPRSNGPEFSAAKQKELLGLLERGTFKVVLREEIPKNAPVMKGRFVLVIKNRETDHEVYKARYVVQGFLDPLKQRAVHNSPNLRQDTSRLVMALASICGFEAWTLDISQAFLQAANENMRDIFLQPPIKWNFRQTSF